MPVSVGSVAQMKPAQSNPSNWYERAPRPPPSSRYGRDVTLTSTSANPANNWPSYWVGNEAAPLVRSATGDRVWRITDAARNGEVPSQVEPALISRVWTTIPPPTSKSRPGLLACPEAIGLIVSSSTPADKVAHSRDRELRIIPRFLVVTARTRVMRVTFAFPCIEGWEFVNAERYCPASR